MITVYTRDNQYIRSHTLTLGEKPPENTVWIDLLNPEENERVFISSALDIDLPNAAEMMEIETSSRLYVQNGTLYLTTDILVGSDSKDPIVDVILITLSPRCITTVRYSEPRAVEIYANRIQQQPEMIATLEDGLISFLDAITDRIADTTEALGRRVDGLSRQIFHPNDPTFTKDGKPVRHKERHLHEILQGIGLAGDLTHKIRDCINGMIRLVSFLGPQLSMKFSPEQSAKFVALERDLRSLSEHAQFIAHETTFLLDATLGQINIEQNNIIKIFSVVAVVFLPPTLFASIWGMNFHNMPELSSPEGYYVALGVMLISAFLPLAYFKHRGWL